MQKYTTTTRTSVFLKTVRASVLTLVIVLGGSFASLAIVNAESLQNQIEELLNENQEKNDQKKSLEVAAGSLEEKIELISEEIANYEKQIQENEEEIARLQLEIEKKEAELEKQKELLGANIRAMYIEGDISTLEMLASSNNLSEFVDKQQYRESIKNQITTTLKLINDLKHQLRAEQEEVINRKKDNEKQRTTLAERRAEQRRILSLNESDRARLDNEIARNSERVNELRAEQARQNAALFGDGGGQVGGGGYPWGTAPCLSTGQVAGWCPDYEWGYDGSYLNWSTGGYAYRNCTDWVSWRIRSSGRHVPGGLGNAKTWDDRAPSYGYAVSETPKAGSAAVSNAGYYGHVMYVEAVNGDGSIVISDYNRAGPGEYGISTLSRETAQLLRYVYF